MSEAAIDGLTAGLNRYRLRLERELLDELEAALADWPPAPRGAGVSEAEASAFQTFACLRHQCEGWLEAINRLRARFAEFNRRHARAVTGEEREQLCLGMAAALGSTDRELEADRKAFSRWFGIDAIGDRFHAGHAALERRVAFCVERIGVVAVRLLERDGGRSLPLWERLRLETLLQPLLAYDGDSRVRLAAFRALAGSIRALPQPQRERALAETTVSYIYRSAQHSSQDLWVQCEALELLEWLSPDSLQRVLAQRLVVAEGESSGDTIFLRRRAVDLLVANLQRLPDLQSLLPALLNDPSPAVRQRLAQRLDRLPAEWVPRLLVDLAGRDRQPVVRASALLSLLPLLRSDRQWLARFATLLAARLAKERDGFVLRVALEVAIGGGALLEVEGVAEWSSYLLRPIHRLHREGESAAVRRQAARAREWLWLRGHPPATALYLELRPLFSAIREGRSVALPRSAAADPDLLGRVLARLVEEDFGAEVELHRWRPRIQRGQRFGFRLWRLLHEWRHPSSDKRQAHRHTIGRLYRGLLQAPAHGLAELAETKVPGEPLMIEEEQGWRPALPLVDQAISTIDQGWPGRPLLIYSDDGVTELQPPPGLLSRLYARMVLTLSFHRFAELRNWQEGRHAPANGYARALESLGFALRFRPHSGINGEPWPADPALQRLFPALVLPEWEVVRERVRDYFFSVYENTLPHLILFLTVASTLFVGRHIQLNRRLRRARRRLPLVIGGWGTRGKSGTERLKAGLFNALGYSVVSKTTGCEAMFLHAPAYGTLREMFLFRPYDKATIWEQMGVVMLARELRCEVFLWECMGLTPSYVRVLQRDWMRDDLSTITNSYPDHEDLQGPAGHDIPRVMANFIPESATLITSEESMLPILREEGRAVDTAVRSVGWLEAGLIPPDLLARFPYQEHPYNIALVLAMARELGIDEEYALKEMADRVVPDLGVLKSYPIATIDGRRLEFVMGMSANERYGALGNWRRMGFDRHSLAGEPDIWVATVVNNRADRVPRSRVFASILVDDIVADCHILIGTNLNGLLGYLREAWQESAAALTLFDQESTPLESLREVGRRLRVATTSAELEGRLLAMVRGVAAEVVDEAALRHWLTGILANGTAEGIELPAPIDRLDHAAAILRCLRRDLDRFWQWQGLVSRLDSGMAEGAIDQELRELAWHWFSQSLVVVEESHATGNQVIRTIVDQTPPGLLGRVMGMQNIKGTGLDFVYRWQAWERCSNACDQLFSDDPVRFIDGVHQLAAFQEYGPLCRERVVQALTEARTSRHAQREELQAELLLIGSNMERALADAAADDRRSAHHGGLLRRLVDAIEAFLDAGDAVRRRRRADTIYADLATMRISQQRAALELQQLNRRQKGGWLAARLLGALRT